MSAKAADLRDGGLRRVNLSFNNKNYEPTAKELAFVLRPDWRDAPGAIDIVRFTDGITNTV